MFFMLLLATLSIAAAASFLVARFFEKPIGAILARIVAEKLASAWQTYMKFAIYVTGISGGVRIWELEQYITPREKEAGPIVLTADRWMLEITAVQERGQPRL